MYQQLHDFQRDLYQTFDSPKLHDVIHPYHYHPTHTAMPMPTYYLVQEVNNQNHKIGPIVEFLRLA